MMLNYNAIISLFLVFFTTNESIKRNLIAIKKSALSMSSENCVKKRVWEDLVPLPIINHDKYRRKLLKYVQKHPKKTVLLVYGPKSVGKSTVLQEAVISWKAEKRLVIDINLKGEPISPDKMFEKLVNSYTIWSISNVKTENFIQTALSALRDVFSFIQQNVATIQLPGLDINDTQKSFKVAQACTEFVMNQLKQAFPNNSIQENMVTFLSALEEKAKKEDTSPVLIIREVQKLIDGPTAAPDAQKIFNSLFMYFEKYKEGGRSLGVIIESSENLWDDLRRYAISSPDSFQPCPVTPWSKEEGREGLVTKHHIFYDSEYEKVWEEVGGHAGQLSLLYESLISGDTLEEAIALRRNNVLASFISTCEGPEGEDYEDFKLDPKKDGYSVLERTINARVALLIALRKAKYSLPKKEFKNHRLSIKYFARKNILWVDNMSVSPVHMTMKNAMEEYLSEIAEEEDQTPIASTTPIATPTEGK